MEREKRTLEEQLKDEANLRRLAVVVRDSNDAVTVQDFSGHILAWNLGAVRMYGYSEVKALGMNALNLVPKERQEENRRMLANLAQGAGITSFETQRLTKDGRVLDVWLVVSPLSDAEGLTKTFSTSERDITERKRAVEELKESEERFRSFFELSPDLVCIADIAGFFRQVNASFHRALGYSKEEILGKPFMDFVHPDDRDKTVQVIEEKLRQGKTVLSFENRYVRKDGGVVWLEWTAQPMEAKDCTFAIARDITERKREEEEVREQKEALASQLEDLQQSLEALRLANREPAVAVKASNDSDTVQDFSGLNPSG